MTSAGCDSTLLHRQKFLNIHIPYFGTDFLQINYLHHISRLIFTGRELLFIGERHINKNSAFVSSKDESGTKKPL